jgi:predicted nucleic acid-binding protein
LAGYYFDSSAAVKRYVSESGTGWVSGLLAPAAGNSIYTARITAVEVVAAITRRARGGTLAPPDAAAAITRFRADLDVLYQAVDVAPAPVEEAMALAELHGLRGYDAVHLSAALRINRERLFLGLPALTLVSADAELNAAAAAEGLAVENPNQHP